MSVSGQGSSADHFTSLPNEILAEIAMYLPENDRLKLRAVLPRSYEKFIVDLFGEKFKRFYLFPTQRSLEDFAEICSMEFFQRHVTEVVYVPRTFFSKQPKPVEIWRFNKWYYTERTGPEFDENDHGEIAESSFKAYLELIEEHEPYSQLADLVVPSLLSLPFLKSTSISKRISAARPGLNIAMWYQKEGQTSNPDFTSLDLAIEFSNSDHKSLVTNRYSGPSRRVSQFLSILAGSSVQELNLGDFTTGQLSFKLFDDPGELGGMMSWMSETHESLARTFDSLQSLTISCKDLGSPVGGWLQSSFWPRFTQCFDNIATLTIQLARRTEPPWRRQENGRRVSTRANRHVV